RRDGDVEVAQDGVEVAVAVVALQLDLAGGDARLERGKGVGGRCGEVVDRLLLVGRLGADEPGRRKGDEQGGVKSRFGERIVGHQAKERTLPRAWGSAGNAG